MVTTSPQKLNAVIQKLNEFPRQHLACLPTPIHPLKRLSAHLGGPEIWVKRDDLTGLAGGGNKTRKLEFIVADAIAQGADTLVTVGGIQSNHTRQTAAAAAIAGLNCELLQMNWVPWDGAEYDKVGNLLLSKILDAKTSVSLRKCAVGESEPEFTELLDRIRNSGGKPYVVPGGASDHPLGGLGYVMAAVEIAQQSETLGLGFHSIVHATSSGSTQAGLIAGLQAVGSDTKVVGIDVNDDPNLILEAVPRILRSTLALLRVEKELEETDLIDVRDEFEGPGYGLPSEETYEAIRLIARLEGILVDPVYEGKAIEGLIDMIKNGEFGNEERILYLHLGGTPALHAYAGGFKPF